MENLYIENIHKSFSLGRIKALQGLDFSVSPGIFGLLGPNGAGKTTLIRILSTAIRADQGSIHWRGLDWNRPAEVTKHLGYLPQQFRFYTYLTIREALDDVALFKGIEKKADRRKEVDLSLERSNLVQYQDRKIGQLSGGMLRRVGIAQAILGSPPLLIVDEPSSGLDPTERIHLRNLLREYNDGQRIILISSHIVEDIETLCDSVAVIDRGLLRAQGTVDELRVLSESYVCERDMQPEEYRSLEKEHVILSFRPEEDRLRVRYLRNETEPLDYLTAPRLEDSYMKIIGDSNHDR